MVDLRTSALGRGNVALGNLLGGDPRAAVPSLLSPASLSPEETRTLVDRMGLSDSPFAPVFETITNPLVLIGAVLAYKFPVTKLTELGQVSKQIAAADRAPLLGPWMHELKSPMGIFKDRPDVVDALVSLGYDKHKFHVKYQGRMHEQLAKYAEKVGRPLNRREGFLLTAHLDGLTKMNPRSFEKMRKTRKGKGQLQTPLDLEAIRRDWTPELEELSKGVREVFDDVFDEVVVRNPEMREELILALTKKHKSLTKKQIAKRLDAGDLKIDKPVRDALKNSKSAQKIQDDLAQKGFVEPGQRLDDYWPHALPRDLKEYRDWVTDLIKATDANAQTWSKSQIPGIAKEASPRTLKRYGRMIPDVRHLDEFPEYLHTRRAEEFKDFVAVNGDKIAPYGLDLEHTMSTYIHQMSSTYGFNVKGAGRKLLASLDELVEEGDSRAAMLGNTLIPLAAGRPSFTAAVKAQWWASLQHRAAEFLDREPIQKMLGTKMHSWLKRGVSKQSGPFTAMSLDANAASLMYHGALGGNFGSATLNSMQSLLTTIPYLGTDAVRGMARVVKQVPVYVKGRLAGRDHLEALSEAFPDFVEMGLGGTGKLLEDVGRSVEDSFRRALGTPTGQRLRHGWTKSKQALMFMFEKTEAMNQLVAFEGAMAKGAREGLKKAEAMPLARKVVLQTQFPSGVENTPVVMSRIKQLPGGKSLSMFSQFTARYAEFLLSTATAAGSGAKGDRLFGRNWGTLGRAAVLSGVAYELGKGYLGTDVSRGLMTGAAPVPEEGRPFYPLPYAPPIASLLGGAVMDFQAGEFDDTRYNLPILVPGGVAAARLVGYASPELAQRLGRKFVDYQHRTPDGRFAVYSGSKPENPTLVGFMSPQELLMQGLGFPGKGIAGREVEAMQWLTKNRDRISQTKRTYLNALLRNDYAGAHRVAQEFERGYPGRGGIQAFIKKQDMRAVHLRRNVTRLERVLDTMPAGLREDFAYAINAAVIGNSDQFLGVDPRLLATSTSRGRDPHRFSTRTSSQGLPNVYGF